MKDESRRRRRRSKKKVGGEERGKNKEEEEKVGGFKSADCDDQEDALKQKAQDLYIPLHRRNTPAVSFILHQHMNRQSFNRRIILRE